MSSAVQLPPQVDVAGVPFHVASLERAAAWALHTVRDPNAPAVSIRLANAYCVALASTDPRYRELLAGSGVNFPDGIPVVAVMRALGADPAEARRVRGPSFFREVLREGVAHDLRHFFVGATPQTLDALTRAVQDQYPGARISGSYSPPFGDVDDAYLDDLVQRAGEWDADVIWVGMGTPKQDFVADALARRAGVVSIGVGAGFDFLAGSVPEAPRWVQRSGLEWGYRLAREPRRLWRRYLFGNSRFASMAVQQLVASGRGRHLFSREGLRRNGSQRLRGR